jgi:hypothetical protein
VNPSKGWFDQGYGQDGVGHQLDVRARTQLVVEAHLVADRAADDDYLVLGDRPRDIGAVVILTQATGPCGLSQYATFRPDYIPLRRLRFAHISPAGLVQVWRPDRAFARPTTT